MCRLYCRSWIRSELSGSNGRHIRLSETRTCTQHQRYAPKWLSMGQENFSTVSNTPGNAKSKLIDIAQKAGEKIHL
jgi:hypothetical protein